MSLQKQTVDIPIVGGVDGNTEGLVRTRLDECSNAQMRKKGGVSKRYGTSKLSTRSTVQFGASTAPPVPETIGASGSDCLRIGVGEISSFSRKLDAANNGQRVYRDQASECLATYDLIAGGTKSYVHPDVGLSSNGFLVYVYRESISGSLTGVVYASVIDSVSGTAVMDRVSIATTGNNNGQHIVVLGTNAYAVYADNGNRIICTKLDLTNIAAGWTAPAVLAADCATLATIDVCAAASGVTFYVAYAKNAGANRIVVREFNAALANIWAGTSADAFVGTVHAMAVTADATNVWATWSYSTGGNDIILGSRFAVATAVETAGPVTWETHASAGVRYAIAIGMCLLSATQCAVVWSDGSGTVGVDLLSTAIASLLPTSDTYTICPNGVRLMSKPWVQDGKVFCTLASGNDWSSAGGADPGSLYIVDTNCSRTAAIWAFTPVRVVASIAPRQINYLLYQNGATLSAPVQPASGEWLVAAYSSFTGVAGAGGSIAGVTATFNRPRQIVEASGITLVTGGVPSTYDGKLLTEIGFHERPRIGTAIVHVPGGTGLMSPGTVSLKLVHEWPDATGRICRSQPSGSISVTGLVANDAIDVTFYPTGPTCKADAENAYAFPVAATLYRTVSGGTAYHRVTSVPYRVTNGPKSVSFTVGAAQIYTESDATTLTQPELYTEGGVLDNVAPPSAAYAVAYRNRFWLAGTPDDTIWYSKSVVAFEALGFNEGLTIPSFEGGRVTALAALENALIVFKAGSIYVMLGDGFDDTGANSSLSEPQRVSADTGCTNAQSVVLTPDGIMFQSERGIYLLNRDFALQFIGEDVADLTQALNTTITSATLVASQSVVRFTLSFPETERAANVLVYDYLHRIWTTANYFDVQGGTFAALAGGCMADGAWRFVTKGGQEFEESATTYLDGGTAWVTMAMRTAWIKLAGVIQGYQRVWRARFLSEYQSAHGASLTTEVNFDLTTVRTAAFPESVFATLYAERIEVSPNPQRCDSIRLSWQDSPPAVFGTGQGSILEGVTLEYGVQPGMNRGLPPAQKG